MNELTKELQLSPRWAALVLTVLAAILVWQSDHAQMESHRIQMLLTALLVYTACGAAWIITFRPFQAGTWVVLGLVTLAIQAIILTGGFPGTLPLVVVPALLALCIRGHNAGLGAAGFQSVVILGAWHYGWLASSAMTASLLGIWTVLGIASRAYQQTWTVANRLWHEYLEARAALHTARERNVLLDQTKDGLVHANRQLYLLNERLAALRAHAEEVEAGKTTFITKVSHEFRSPLNMIIGLTDLLIDAPNVYGSQMPARLMEDILILHRNCLHLTSMINDVLDLSQTEAGRLTLHMDWEDLGQEIHIAAENVEPLFTRKELQLHLNIPTPLPAVYCDRTRVRQVLLNLLTNAGRYTEKGAVTVTASASEKMVRISIADTGPGIARQDQARIFEPFFQSAGTTAIAKAGEGSGLGLSICKQFVELHRGKLWLESEVGQGTVFFVELPIAAPVQLKADSRLWLIEEWPWISRENRKSMPVLPQRLRVVLYDETGQLEKYTAFRANEIEWIQTHSIPDAIRATIVTPAHLLLLNTSTVAGLPSLMRQVQSTVTETPIVGCAFPAQVEHILQAGAIDYLIKPVTRADLFQAIYALDDPISLILLVDDDPDLLNLLGRMLHSHDSTLSIITANNGQEALSIMATARPDLVFLDLMMPIMDGWQVLAHKEKDATLRDIPVIILSSQDPAATPPSTEWMTISWNQGLSIETAMRSALGAAARMVAGEKAIVTDFGEAEDEEAMDSPAHRVP